MKILIHKRSRQSMIINSALSHLKRNLNNVNYQRPMAHAETAPDHSFGLFLLQYPPRVSLMLQLFWLIQLHPAKSGTHTISLETIWRVKLTTPYNGTKFLTNNWLKSASSCLIESFQLGNFNKLVAILSNIHSNK